MLYNNIPCLTQNGVLIPIINKIVAPFDSEPNDFQHAINAPSTQEWCIIFYYKNIIDSILSNNNWQPINSTFYWSSSLYQFSKSNDDALYVHTFFGNIYTAKISEKFPIRNLITP